MNTLEGLAVDVLVIKRSQHISNEQKTQWLTDSYVYKLGELVSYIKNHAYMSIGFLDYWHFSCTKNCTKTYSSMLSTGRMI